MSTPSTTASATLSSSTNNTVATAGVAAAAAAAAATSSSSNPSSSTSGGGNGGTTLCAVPLGQNMVTAIHLKPISETINSTSVVDVDKISALKKLSSITTTNTTATPIVAANASSIQPIANLISTQHAAGMVKSKIVVCGLTFYLFLFA